MNIDDFFSKVDTTLQKTTEAEGTVRQAATTNEAFLREAIARLAPLFSTYKDKVRARGLYAMVEAYPTALAFVMRYRDGGHHTLHIGGELKTSRLQIRTFYTNDDGKDFHSTDGKSFDSSTWKDSLAESRLQTCIEDFLFYADRHGGPESLDGKC